MTRFLGAIAAALILCLSAQGQPIGTSDLYQAFLRSGGLPYRQGEGFYIPESCTYVVDYYTQCGGSGASCLEGSGVCADAQYPGACCPSGFTCSRQNPQYWQCVPQEPTYPGASPGVTLLPAFGQCGGNPPANSTVTVNALGQFENVLCPEGYTCQYQDATYSLCQPNPLFAPQQSTERPLLSILQSLIPGGQALAPGLEQYNFNVPGKTEASPKPVSLTVNTTKIGEIFDGLLNIRSPPPAPLASPPPPFPPTPPSPAPGFNFTVPIVVFQPPAPVTIQGTNIVDASGNVVSLNGLNWFGFEIGSTMVDGLYANYANPRNFSQVGDFSTIVYRQQALGFNAIRLPFRFADLNIAPPKSYTRPCSVDSQAQIIGNLSNPTVPYYQIDYANRPFPAQTAPILPPQDVATTGLCNSYLPSDTTLNRFLYVIQFYIANGFYVAIDYHAGLGSIETDRQVVANPSLFQSNWLGLLQAIQALPTFQANIRGRLFFDLLNEPDAFNFTWSSPNTNSQAENANSTNVEAWGTLFTDTAALLLRQEPSLLFFAEGTGQKNQPGTAYGQGFGINPAIYDNRDGFANALGGLQTLVSNRAVRAATIITPHVYGGQVTGWTEANGGGNTDDSGLGLPYTYYNNWAYLSSTGVPDPATGAGATFPVLVGEFGNVFNSSFNATVNNFSDPFTDRWLHDFAQFANNLEPVNKTNYPHANINNTFYWSWNGNNLPQLGLVNADPGFVPDSYVGPLQPGWLQIQWIKINNLTSTLVNNPFFSPADAVASGGGFGLRPWYLR